MGERISIRSRRSTKSRKACDNCRKKKMKCDEQRPACFQCTKRAISCPGYETKLCWSTKHEIFLNDPALFEETAREQHYNLKTSKSNSPISFLFCEDSFLGIDNEILLEKSPFKRMVVESKQRKESSIHLEDEISAEQRGNNWSNATVLPVSHDKVITRQLPGTNLGSVITGSQDQPLGNTIPYVNDLQCFPLQNSLEYRATYLVDRYFLHVCTIFSSFDTDENPFRTAVGQLWQNSAPIYYAIQSMAAAYLANANQALEHTGVILQLEAYRQLSHEMEIRGDEDESNADLMIAVLLLGLSTSWHDSSDIGTVHLLAARRLILKWSTSQIGQKSVQQASFFQQCMLYWEMLAVFVGSFPHQNTSTNHETEHTNLILRGTQVAVHPHPWTGVAPTIQHLFSKVGALVRESRQTAIQDNSFLDFFSFEPELSPAVFHSRAEVLEDLLLSFQLPPEDSVIDTGDPNTPVAHLITISEAYRCTALLLLYHVWPEIARKRLPACGRKTETPSHNCKAIWDQMSKTTRKSFMDTTQDVKDWLTDLALHILEMLSSLPSTSGTRFLQPIILLCASNELRSNLTNSAEREDMVKSESNRLGLDVKNARQFVLTRVIELGHALPMKPLVQVERLIKEIWVRMDLGQEALWLDVMVEMGWETIMG